MYTLSPETTSASAQTLNLWKINLISNHELILSLWPVVWTQLILLQASHPLT